MAESVTPPSDKDGLLEEVVRRFLSGDSKSDAIAQIATAYLGQKIQSKNILNYNGANLAFNHAQHVASQLGLDPSRVTPFPQHTSIAIQQAAPSAESREVAAPAAGTPVAAAVDRPWWQPYVVGAGMLAAGAALGPVGSWVAGRVIPAAIEATPKAEPVATDAGTGGSRADDGGSAEVGFRVE